MYQYQYEYKESVPKYCDLCSHRIDNEIVTIILTRMKGYYHKTCYQKMIKFSIVKNPSYKNIHTSELR